MPKKSWILISYFLFTFALIASTASANNTLDQETVLYLEDAVGDDHGCGTVVYPTNEVFVDGLFDLLTYRVFLKDENVVFELQFREITNPWNLPNGFSHQFIEILIDQDRERDSGNTNTLYNANFEIYPEEAWEYAIIADGGGWSRHDAKVVESNGAETRDGVLVRSDSETNRIFIYVSQSIIGNPKNNWLHTVLIGSSDWGQFRKVDAIASEQSFGGGLDRDIDPNVIDILKSEEFDQETLLANPSVFVTFLYKEFLVVSTLMFLASSIGFMIYFLVRTKKLESTFSKFFTFIKKDRKIVSIIITLWLGVFALILRWQAVFVLDVQPDEKVYVPISMHYAEAIKNADWNEIINYDLNIEHPIFSKLIYSIPIILTDSINFEEAMTACRVVSMLFTVGNIMLISQINPIAGFLFSVNSWSITYSSIAYLDSPAIFFSTLAILAFNQSKFKLNRYLIISAVATGMGFASKYNSIATSIIILMLLLWNDLKPKFTHKRLKPSICYGAISIFVFFLCNPIVWTNTNERLYQSLIYHKEFPEQSEWVKKLNYPIEQQFLWLSNSNPWHARKFLFQFDSYVLFLGLLGFPFLCNRKKIYALWYLSAALFLSLYPVKWPQYTLMFIPPLALSVGEIVGFHVRIAHKHLKRKINI